MAPAEDGTAGTRGSARDNKVSEAIMQGTIQLQLPKPLRMEGDMAKNWRMWRQMRLLTTVPMKRNACVFTEEIVKHGSEQYMEDSIRSAIIVYVVRRPSCQSANEHLDLNLPVVLESRNLPALLLT